MLCPDGTQLLYFTFAAVDAGVRCARGHAVYHQQAYVSGCFWSLFLRSISNHSNLNSIGDAGNNNQKRGGRGRGRGNAAAGGNGGNGGSGNGNNANGGNNNSGNNSGNGGIARGNNGNGGRGGNAVGGECFTAMTC